MIIKKYIPFVLALAAFVIGFVGSGCGMDRDCTFFSFFRVFVDSILDPLWIYSLYVLLPAFVVIFFPQKIFKTWLGVSLWTIGISIIILAVFPTSAGLFSFYERGMITPWLGQAYFVISILIFLIQGFLLWNRRNKGN